MTREVTHFSTIRSSIGDNSTQLSSRSVSKPPPKYSNLYFNLSKGKDARGPWNEGESTRLKEEWQYIDDSLQEVRSTNGLVDRKPKGTHRTEKEVQQMDKKLAKERSKEVLSSLPEGAMSWCSYQDK